MFSRFSLYMFDGRGDGNAEERRGEERTTTEVMLICLFACLYVFEFPLPLLLFLLSYFRSHLQALAHWLHAIG
jgi:hypothetical protein